MIYVEQNAQFEGAFDMGITGLVGTMAIEIIDNLGAIVFGPVTTGIVETPAGSGIYGVAFPAAPAAEGQYTIVGSADGSFTPGDVAIDDLVVVAAISAGSLPPIVPPALGGPLVGPCSAWTDGERVAECCDSGVGTFTELLDDAAGVASELLFAFSGSQFSGLCGNRVRPCATRRCGCSWGNGTSWVGSGWDCARPCGCQPLDRVRLAGYPVRAIAEVKIDGVAVDPDTYRLDEWRYLTRVRDPADPTTPLFWPSCQDLDLADDQPGTFSVSYVFGLDPPAAGIAAAGELACQVYLSCSADADGDCVLPSHVMSVTRAGITYDIAAFTAWGRGPDGIWKTGLALVDAFLNAVNPLGIRRKPAIWSPDVEPYARRVG